MANLVELERQIAELRARVDAIPPQHVALNQLATNKDVRITAIANGDVPTWNATMGKFVNRPSGGLDRKLMVEGTASGADASSQNPTMTIASQLNNDFATLDGSGLFVTFAKAGYYAISSLGIIQGTAITLARMTLVVPESELGSSGARREQGVPAVSTSTLTPTFYGSPAWTGWADIGDTTTVQLVGEGDAWSSSLAGMSIYAL